MKARITKCSAALALALALPGSAWAVPNHGCSSAMLQGKYVFSTSGFTRAPGSPPGTPWTPKAIVQVLQFNGNGTLSTPVLMVANPFGDTGAVLLPPAGAEGEYRLDSDCRGTVRFFDASNVTFAIYVERLTRKIHMVQTHPANNVFQGAAVRIL